MADADITQIECPGCGRSVAAVSQTCLYCNASLQTRPPSLTPAARDDGDATRCALCGRFYLTSKHPHGCPECTASFAHPTRGAELREKRRDFAMRALLRGSAGAIAAGAGFAALTWLRIAVPTFGSLRTACLLVGAVVALLLAWRSYEHAAMRQDPAVIVAAVTAVATFAGVVPWCMAASLWANGIGVGGPDIVVSCRVRAVVTDPPTADYDVKCQLDDGTALDTTIRAGAGQARVGSRLAQPVRRGRLGLFVTEREVFTDRNDNEAP